MVGIDSFELTGIKTYTRFWGQLMFGSYCVINIIVLLNLLIAMMSNSFSAIVVSEQEETLIFHSEAIFYNKIKKK